MAARRRKPAEPRNDDTSGPPKRRRGGQELSDDVQDRPEQNLGYDEAVRGDAHASPAELDVMVQDERVDDSLPGEDFLDDDAHHFGDLAVEPDNRDEPGSSGVPGGRRRS